MCVYMGITAVHHQLGRSYGMPITLSCMLTVGHMQAKLLALAVLARLFQHAQLTGALQSGALPGFCPHSCLVVPPSFLVSDASYSPPVMPLAASEAQLALLGQNVLCGLQAVT